MKQREKNSIIIGFIGAVFIFLSSVIYLLKYTYPNILEIESKKIIISKKVKDYDNLKKTGSGFNFDNFKAISTKYKSDEKLKDKLNDSLYEDIDEKFYNNAIYRGSDKYFVENYKTFVKTNDFGDYLSNYLNNLEVKLDGNSIKDKKLKVSGILPLYSILVSLNKEGGLTDLSFINYIEKLLRKYNLKINNPIGIKNIVSVDNNVINERDNIYYIPLDLDITGTKISILKFLEYINNTGKVNFNDNDFTFSDKLGAGSQLSEVESIEFDEYIDGSFKKRGSVDTTLEGFLLTTKQSQDIIKVKTSLKFYISGFSSDKIRKKINLIIGNDNKRVLLDKNGDFIKDEITGDDKYELLHYNHKNLLAIATRLKSSPVLNKSSVYYIRKANNIFSYLDNSNIKKDIKSLKKDMSDDKKLDSIYIKSLKYKEIFLKLDKEIYQIAKSLGIEKDRVDENGKKIKSIYLNNYYF